MCVFKGLNATIPSGPVSPMLEINPSLKIYLKLEHTLQLYKAHIAQQRCCTKLFPACFIKPVNHSGPSGDREIYWTQPVRLKARGAYKGAESVGIFSL